MGLTIQSVISDLWHDGNDAGDSISGQIRELLKQLTGKLEAERAVRKASTVPTLEKPSDYVDTSKTILYWMHDSFTRYRAQCAYSSVSPLLRHIIMMNESDENDLASMASVLSTLVVSK